MKFIHRIAFRASALQRRELEDLDIKVPQQMMMPGGGDPLIAFDIDERHPSWPTLRTRLRQWDVSEGLVRTDFSSKEIEAAQWLGLAAWHHGYPQPDELDFGYRNVTYDRTDWCEQCGIGLRQKAPFQMKGEPKWGKNGILQLNWVFDELFVTPRVWANVFKAYGVGFRSVTNTKGAELKTIVQLKIEDEVGIVADGLPIDRRCNKCDRVKYLPVARGPLPALVSKPARAMVKTREHFGSGASADKCVLISQDLARALAAHEVRG
jgi:hypothetical protein